MTESSRVAVAFRDLADAYDELSSGSTSPKAVRRSFASFVDQSQKLTSYMRKEYREKKGKEWVPKDFDGWNDVTELFKEIRNDDQHDRPVFIFVNETQYFRIFEDTPELAMSGTWSFSLDDQLAVTPRDDLTLEPADPETGLPSGERIAPVRREYEFHLSPLPHLRRRKRSLRISATLTSGLLAKSALRFSRTIIGTTKANFRREAHSPGPEGLPPGGP
jgi:hypothetical protein